MSIEDISSDPYADTRSGSEKKSDFSGAALGVVGLASFLAVRRKISLTRGFSQSVRLAGLNSKAGGAASPYDRYLSSNYRHVKRSSNSSVLGDIRDSGERFLGNTIDTISDLFRPLPSSMEQYAVAQSTLARENNYPVNTFPSWDVLGQRERSPLETLLRGFHVVPFSPNTSLGILHGEQRTTGQYGAVLIGDKLSILPSPHDAISKRRPLSTNVVHGVSHGVVDSMGSSMEMAKRGTVVPVEVNNVEDYIHEVELDPASVYEMERRILIRERYFGRFFGSEVTMEALEGKTSDELAELARTTHDKFGTKTWNNSYSREPEDRVPTIDAFLHSKVESYQLPNRITPEPVTFLDQLKTDAEEMRRSIAKRTVDPTYLHPGEADIQRSRARNAWMDARGIQPETEASRKTVSYLANKRYQAFLLGRKLGIGEEFASYGGGAPQQFERWFRGGAGYNFRHPLTGEMLDVTPRRYNKTDSVLGSLWGGKKGPWYITTPQDTVKRWTNTILSGTFHKVGEKAFGIGITTRSNRFTEYIREMIGAEKGSWADISIRGAGRTARMIAIGMAATYGYKFANFLSREAVGSGPTDWAAGTYVGIRQTQQNILGTLGITNLASTLENAFPGLINSPLSKGLRAAAPLILGGIMGRKGNRKNFLTGFAMGTAIALVTWGDITQSPEELRRIYSGEQDIPVRKGRYWLLGKTPFFGGKISYWRKHWYPLLTSDYQYSGSLWDSEREYWGQGTALSPILAPILTGKLWDPYYWEKKHYRDRPYPITGELFEPTMPFAWVGNATVGNILKRPLVMHADELGNEQSNVSQRDRGVPAYTGRDLGFPTLQETSTSSASSPFDLRYQLGMGAYVQAEQMGLMGWAINATFGKLSGSSDFMESNTMLQTARRATGYERAYWDKDIGDPGAGFDEGLTEYYRRILPHRRSNVDEYNPVQNTMPEWMPGSDYFINFQQGDPYVKVPYGEARLPGPGYEALNELHSGEPGVYDAVDRMLILSNVAPYSDEYKQYRGIAKSAVEGDEYWSAKVNRAIEQREALNDEYEFLDFDTGGTPALLKPLSAAYKHGLAAVTNFANPLDMVPNKVVSGGIPTHINKWLPYKTAESTYEDFRISGSEYAMWDQPKEGFFDPYVSKISRGDRIPDKTERRREIQEYFDKLKYIKYANLAQLAREQGNAALASKLTRVSRASMAAGNFNPITAMMTIPKEERSFFEEFAQAEGARREEILKMVPSYMKNYYMAAWNKADGQDTYDVDYQSSEDLVQYFQSHKLPDPDWGGWHPDVSLEQVKLRVVKSEALDIHKFNLWDSNERQLARQQYTPTIEDINAPTNDMTMLQNVITMNMEKLGMTNTRVYVSRTPASSDTHKINLKIKNDREDDHKQAMSQALSVR